MPLSLESAFDKEKALEALSHYFLSTGIPCQLIDETGAPSVLGSFTYSEGEGINDYCSLCRAYKKITGKPSACQQTHLYGGAMSLRFGGRYTFFCPMSLVHIASPVMIDGVMKASLVGGPFLLIDPEEYLIDELGGRHDFDESQLKEIGPIVRNLPYVTPQRARSLSETLLYTASYLSGVNVQELVEEENRISQQSKISEYMQDLKSMDSGEGKPSYPLEKERKLMDFISVGDKENAVKLLNELLADLALSTGNNFSTIKARTLELVVILSRASVEGGANAEDVFGLNFRAIEDIHSFRTIPQLNLWLSNMVKRFVSFVFDVRGTQHKNVILKALQFIENNFDKKISLEDVANQVILSPTYFSRIFKEESGQSFKSYLNQVRINKSKELLKDNSLQLIEVVGMVGFDDQSYFTRVFKKIVGVSPGQYRQTRGRISEKPFGNFS